jgi:hypothetical protein
VPQAGLVLEQLPVVLMELPVEQTLEQAAARLEEMLVKQLVVVVLE